MPPMLSAAAASLRACWHAATAPFSLLPLPDADIDDIISLAPC